MDRDIKAFTRTLRETEKQSTDSKDFKEGEKVTINDPTSDDIGQRGTVVGVGERKNAPIQVKLESGGVISISSELIKGEKDDDVSFDSLLNDFLNSL